MKYALKCVDGHSYEAWFPSAAAFDAQKARGLVTCPTCGAPADKVLMAPSVVTKKPAVSAPVVRSEPPAPATAAAPTGAAPGSAPPPMMAMTSPDARRRLLEEKLRALRAHVEATSDYVGPRFADEARKIHDGEVEERAIYGEATRDEAEALIEDGVPCAPIPWIDRRDD